MRKYLRPAAFGLMVAATILTTVLRIWLIPGMQETDTGNFKISYVIIGVMIFSFAALTVLILAGKGGITHINNMARADRLPMAISGILFGVVLLMSSLFDVWIWMVYNETPPPNENVINRLDSITLTLTLLFGILAGLFLIWFGIKASQSKIRLTPSFALGALLPVIWIWFKLVRYQVSYASAIPVEQSFYDFAMLIFSMLFLFSFARYISKIGESSSRSLLIYAHCASLMSLSGTIASMSLFMLGETDAYNSSNLAGIADFGLGVFAFCTALSLTFAKKIDDVEQPISETQENEAGFQQEGINQEDEAGFQQEDINQEDVIEKEIIGKEHSSTVDDILRELKKTDDDINL
ncbi:MAG: hypothetical protein PHH84_08135 [Oscillospiraceae bacterium]|nr:hypothetical protein [Oscillospiraceae bacterium]MDD4414851.1 hypothetical protein [Oscillospiraceae bacterium]